MAWLVAMASWVMSTAAGAMLSTEVDVETNDATVGKGVVVAARTEVATQLVLLAIEEAVAADSSVSSSTEIGAGSAMTRRGVTAAADGVVERMVETVPRGTGGNAADLVVDEANAAAVGARVDVAASTRVASQLVVEAVRCRDVAELVVDENRGCRCRGAPTAVVPTHLPAKVVDSTVQLDVEVAERRLDRLL